MRFGIIGEGVTDQEVITAILRGYFNDNGLPVSQLQPRVGEPGNWDKVFKYCSSEDFRNAFPFNDYIVIQVDTDFLRGDSVPEKWRINLTRLSIKEVVECVISLLIKEIGADFYDSHKAEIIFAIAVDQIECWLLPIYFESQPKKANKTTNCTDTLNEALLAREGFYIHSKDIDHYRKIAKHYLKKKTLMACSKMNESLRCFIDCLNAIPFEN